MLKHALISGGSRAWIDLTPYQSVSVGSLRPLWKMRVALLVSFLPNDLFPCLHFPSRFWVVMLLSVFTTQSRGLL